MKDSTLSILSLYLTLFGLLGSFFAVHLSNWFRELLALRQKYEMNKVVAGSNTKQEALRECRYRLGELYNHVTMLVSGLIGVFLLLVFLRGWGLLGPALATGDLVAIDLAWVGGVFCLIFYSLTFYFLIRGYAVGRDLDTKLPTL